MSNWFPLSGTGFAGCRAASRGAFARRRSAPSRHKRRLIAQVLIGALVVFALSAPALARGGGPSPGVSRDTSLHWPTSEQFRRVLTLRDYNTRVVVIGTTLLGVGAGIIGTFLLLRKRALMGDALSHATLPGIGLAFIISASLGSTAKSLPVLLTGALISGAVGIGCVLFIRNHTRIKEDAALGVVMSVFFGLGIAIFGVIQKTGSGHAAGLESFIYGKTASMLYGDAVLIGVMSLVSAAVCALMYKEFALVCFDQDYAASQGWPVGLIDVVMMSLAVIITVVGLQAVGLILMLALLVIPPASARFWTDRLSGMLLVSIGVGAASGFFGAGLSALVPRLPAGAIIVVSASAMFMISLVFGRRRGLVVRVIQRRRLNRRVARQNLLRAIFEWCEPALARSGENAPADRGDCRVEFESLLSQRSWSPRRLRRLLASARRDGLLRVAAPRCYVLTESGLTEARRMVRNHRLWELYLITHAEVAANHVDRDADQLEHVLGRSMVEELEALLVAENGHPAMPASPHLLKSSEDAATCAMEA